MITTTTKEARKTAEALHAEAREILRSRTRAQKDIRITLDEIAAHDARLKSIDLELARIR